MQIKAKEMYVSCESAACLEVLVSELMVSADMRKRAALWGPACFKQPFGERLSKIFSFCENGPELCHIYLNVSILTGTFDCIIPGELTF